MGRRFTIPAPRIFIDFRQVDVPFVPVDFLHSGTTRCFNYCSWGDTSISCQRGQISEEHGTLVGVHRLCSHNCVFRPKTVLVCFNNTVEPVSFAAQWTNVWERVYHFYDFHKYTFGLCEQSEYRKRRARKEKRR